MEIAADDHEAFDLDDGLDDAQRTPHPVRWVAMGVAFVVLMTVALIVGRRLTDSPNRIDSPLLGKAAPAFDLERIDTTGRLATWELRGRVTIVNFWATWCVPCRRENGVLDDFYQRWHGRGLELVGVLYSDTPDAARDFRRELGGTWPLVDDPDAHTAVDYGITGVPETFIIDATGIVVAKLIGAVGPTTLDDILTELAQGAPTVTYVNDGQHRTGP